ncbi:MAG: site-2 protease family protein [Nitrospiraceae bacterium]|nr:site-2 protease family protein [Nitrospiraceae bacterium]
MADEKGKRKNSGINLFRVAGIRISLDFSWFIIFFLLLWSLSAVYFPHVFPNESVSTYWFAGLLATVLFFASVLFHELSHSLVAIHHGIAIPSITLFIFGGISQLSEDAKDPKTEFKIAIAGPLSSFVLAGLFWVLKSGMAPFNEPVIQSVFSYLMWVNIALGAFNLIPGFPLDGGRVLRAFWWWKKGSLKRATRLASDIGKSFAIFLIIMGGFQVLFMGALISGLWFVFIGLFLRSVAQAGYQDMVLRRSLENVLARDVMVEDIVSVNENLPLSSLIRDYFLHYGYKGFPVVEDGRTKGVVSLFEVKKVPEDQYGERTVGQVMEPLSAKVAIPPETPLSEALAKMKREGVGRLLIMRDGQLIGMVTKDGLMRFIEIKQVLEPD